MHIRQTLPLSLNLILWIQLILKIRVEQKSAVISNNRVGESAARLVQSDLASDTEEHHGSLGVPYEAGLMHHPWHWQLEVLLNRGHRQSDIRLSRNAILATKVDAKCPIEQVARLVNATKHKGMGGRILTVVSLFVDLDNGCILRQSESGLALLVEHIAHGPGVLGVVQVQELLSHENEKGVLWIEHVLLLLLHLYKILLDILGCIRDDLVGLL
jgi:hypothetical protein